MPSQRYYFIAGLLGITGFFLYLVGVMVQSYCVILLGGDISGLALGLFIIGTQK